MKKIIGYLMLISLFFGIFLLVALFESFLAALFLFGTAALLIGFILLANYLIDGDKSDS